jgi:hypothetical protein
MRIAAPMAPKPMINIVQVAGSGIPPPATVRTCSATLSVPTEWAR